jgi:hypothetical protein
MAVGVDTLALIINAERNGAGAPIAQCAAERHKKVKFWVAHRILKSAGVRKASSAAVDDRPSPRNGLRTD